MTTTSARAELKMIKDITPGITIGSDISNMTDVNGTLFFSVEKGP